ncbi:hypothetical protein B0H67DRAFT_35848 [Lasiosphaeris hirsuta]|uniref:Uncharacterized protein n=1 Tax=Lasiosphaeris hirsuta TaxID=260670 RepID=A0AA40ECN1_9PEZI|nr:hypothetical protein B0H67DRAFT_35848 [Lasiosphaeris hirsuta]
MTSLKTVTGHSGKARLAREQPNSNSLVCPWYRGRCTSRLPPRPCHHPRQNNQAYLLSTLSPGASRQVLPAKPLALCHSRFECLPSHCHHPPHHHPPHHHPPHHHPPCLHATLTPLSHLHRRPPPVLQPSAPAATPVPFRVVESRRASLLAASPHHYLPLPLTSLSPSCAAEKLEPNNHQELRLSSLLLHLEIASDPSARSRLAAARTITKAHPPPRSI